MDELEEEEDARGERLLMCKNKKKNNLSISFNPAFLYIYFFYLSQPLAESMNVDLDK